MSETDFPTLHTARLRLRQLREGDAVDFHRLLLTPGVNDYSNWPEAPDAQRCRELVDNMSQLFPKEFGCAWVIEELATGRFVGAIRFNYFQTQARCGGIGYESHPDFWGKGLMSEAVRAVVACGHGRFGLNRIEAWTLPGNDASDRVLQKTGFAYEGTQRQKAWFKNRFHDFRWFGRLATDPR